MTFTYERRLATFRQLNWPHSASVSVTKKYKSQPEDFAQAGFYCRPMAGSEDTVACFLCLKSLDGWEPSDSAWKEHKSHSAQCPLVTLNLQASRLRTFDKWPGERVKGGVAELAAAGFFHFPKTDNDDTCICFQCGLALDGWEAGDDPHHEHSRRRPNCPHVAGKGYMVPASFDFILSGQADDLAVKDFNNALVNVTKSIVPSTPMTAKKQIIPSTVKSTAKKIRISTVTSTSTKQQQEYPQNENITNDFFKLFPALLKDKREILNLTVEQLFDRLIKEKVGMYEEFLRQQQQREQ